MTKSIDVMNYKEFKQYCNDRACDGNWGMTEVLNCISIMEHVDAVKVKGLFKKKQTEQAQEEAWQKVLASIKKEALRNDK